MGQQIGCYGAEYSLPYGKFPYLALSKTYNTNAQPPDSAGTATAMNNGVKTNEGVIGLSASARPGACAAIESAMLTSFADRTLRFHLFRAW
jgi:alkaline phosphatase